MPRDLDSILAENEQLRQLLERGHAQMLELIKARDEAKDADHAKSSFLANMSHELRTPLNAIIGFSEMMQCEVAGPLNEKYRSYVEDIQRSGLHLKEVVNGILDLSKIEMGSLELREAPIYVPDITDACIRLVGPLASTGQVCLASAVAPSLPTLWGDETRLKQALLNLLSNAVKFTDIGGNVSLDVRMSGSNLTFVIADTGIGMRPEDIVVAFQPFRQIQGAFSRRCEGTGLGLPLAKAFVELHGGTLTLQSAPEVGTTAKIMLPAARLKKAA
jgi:signal transduction histidine kinase